MQALKLSIAQLIISLLTYFAVPIYADIQVMQINNERTPYSYAGNSVSLDCEYLDHSLGNQISNFVGCKLTYANLNQSKHFTTSQKLDNQTTLVWYNTHYASLNSESGTGNSGQVASIIFNFNNMTHTPVLENFIALDPKLNLIAINAQYIEDNKLKNLKKILITGLYDHSKGMLVNFPNDADVSMIIDPGQSKFDQYGNLIINYSTTGFDMNTATIPINPLSFVVLDPKMIKYLGLKFTPF